MTHETKQRLYDSIYREHIAEPAVSVRALARRHKTHRRTVRRALVGAAPPRNGRAPGESPILGPWASTIDRWIVEASRSGSPSELSAAEVWRRLSTEHGVVVSRSAVRRHVARAKSLHTPPTRLVLPDREDLDQSAEPGVSGDGSSRVTLDLPRHQVEMLREVKWFEGVSIVASTSAALYLADRASERERWLTLARDISRKRRNSRR